MAFELPPEFQDRYREVNAGGLRGLADAAFWAALSDELRADPPAILSLPDAQPVKDSRNILARAEFGEGAERRTIWIKQFRPRGLLSWVQRAGRAGKAERGWNTAFALLKTRVATPRPLLGLRGAGRLGGARGLLIVENAEGDPLRAWLKRLEPESKERARFMRALGEFIGRMHARGFAHRDLSGGNILIQWAPESTDPPAISVIDINRMRKEVYLGEHMRLRDLERVRLADTDLEAFFYAYEAQGAAPCDLRESFKTHSQQYCRMREAKSPLAKFWHKARYYWDDFRAIA